MEVHTYGGLKILEGIFNGVAMMSNNGTLKSLVAILVLFAAIWTLSKSLLSSSVQPIIMKFFLPVLLVCSFLMVPKTKVRIVDAIQGGKVTTVDHVPFLLGFVASVSSKIGYNITTAIESVMHVPNDTKYNSTGMIFGAQSYLDVKKYKIRDSDFERNLRSFSKQCLFFDLVVGRYSIDDLKKTTDIWEFLKKNTSAVNMMTYVSPKKADETGKKIDRSTTYRSCSSVLEDFDKCFDKEKKFYTAEDFAKNLPATFQAITGLEQINQDAKTMIGQQIMMNFLGNGFDRHGFAATRAKEQQRDTYLTLGALAGSSLITMRVVFEALLIASFVFVVPLSVLLGFKTLFNWVFMVLWIQLWPPFYAILNYIMQLSLRAKTQTILQFLSEDQYGLSFFTSSGMQDLYQDIFALSGYLSASIPFLSYAVIKGGVASFMHLAGAMMTPAHQSAGSAAAEISSGNYNYANTSFGQESYVNRTALQNNLAPSLSHGYTAINEGRSIITRSEGFDIYKEARSDLKTSLLSDESLSTAHSQMTQEAQSYVDSNTQTLNESFSSLAKNSYDLSNYLSSSESLADADTLRNGQTLSTNLTNCMNEVSNFAKQQNISENDAWNMTLKLGFEAFGTGTATAFSDVNTTDEAWSHAKNIAENENFQKGIQDLMEFSSSSTSSTLSDEGKRLAEGFSRSIDSVHSAQEQHQKSLTNLEQVSNSETYTKQMSIQQRSNLDQDFVDFVNENHGSFEYLNTNNPKKKKKTLYVRLFLMLEINAFTCFSVAFCTIPVLMAGDFLEEYCLVARAQKSLSTETFL